MTARFAMGVSCAIVLAPAALACAVCFGDPESAQAAGMNSAIAVMLGVTAVVLGAIAAFGWHLAKRAGSPPGGE